MMALDPQLVLRALGDAIERSLRPGLVTLSLDGRVTSASSSFVEMFGWSLEELLAFTPPYPLWPPEEVDRIVPQFEAVMSQDGTPAPLELTFCRKNGERVPILMQPSPLKGEDGALIGWLAIVTDLSEQHRSAALAEASEQRYRDLANAMPQIVWSARADGYTDYYNDRWYELTGVARGAEGDGSWQPIVHPDDRERALQTWHDAVQTGEPYEIEYRFLDAKSNTYRWHLGRGLPVRDAAGRIVRWYGTATDIEDLKRAQDEVGWRREALERQNFMLRTLLDVSEILSAEREQEKLLQSITDAATMLAGAEFGAFFYNVADEDGGTYMLWTVSGAPREAFSKYPMPRNTAVFAPTFAGTTTIRSDDIRQDPRYGRNPPHHGMPQGHLPVVSYLAVPVVSRSGEVIGGLFFGHSAPAKFSEDAERLVAGVAAQAAISIDNLRLLDQARRNEARMRVQEERYRTLVTATAQTVWSTEDGVPSVQSENWLDTVHPDDRERFAAAWDQARAAATPYEVELRLRSAASAYRWFSVRGVPLNNEDGSVREWIGTLADVDERKRSDESASFLADASALLTASLDPETILRRLAGLAVPRLADWCAIDVARENGPHQRLVIAHPDREKAAMIMEVDQKYRVPDEKNPTVQVLRSRKPHLLEHIEPAFVESFAQDERHLEIIRALGLRSWIIAPILAGGRVYGTLSLVHAESGRHFSERDLPFAEDLASRVGVAVYNAMLYVEAQAANRAKDEFLATLSHELRTPMTAIVGWARMLEMGDLDPVLVREGIQAIARGAKTQAQLIDDILDVSRITLGKLHLTIADVDVNEIVSNAVEAVHPTADLKNIVIDARFDGGEPHVSGDVNRLQQVVWNLVNNAVKFTPKEGRVEVAVERVDGSVRILVRDTGEGISAEFLPHIFDRFRQADSTTTRRFGGLGLGLAIVRQLTEMHGGEVSVASDGIGHGSTFTVTLPLARNTTARAKAASSQALPELRGVDVLVVDDDDDARRFIAAALQRAGASVRDAGSAEEALAALRDRIPAVLVTDIAMPGRDGFDLLEEARKHLGIDDQRMPAIAITAFGGTQDRTRILDAGFRRYILKPVDPVELARNVAELL